MLTNYSIKQASVFEVWIMTQGQFLTQSLFHASSVKLTESVSF